MLCGRAIGAVRRLGPSASDEHDETLKTRSEIELREGAYL